MELQQQIEAAWDNRELLKEESTKETIRAVIEELDKGRLRVAEPSSAQLSDLRNGNNRSRPF